MADFGHLYIQSRCGNNTKLVFLICSNGLDINFQSCSENV